MVFAADSEEERLHKLMAMGNERSKLLHNFTLPCLKWGNQKHLRCMKVNSAGRDVSGSDRRPSASKLESFVTSQRRKSVSETREFFKDSEKKLSASQLGIGTNGDDGIEAIGRKLLFDLKTTADNLKNTMLREEMVQEEEKENDDAAKMRAAAAAAAETPASVDAKPWNLRTRRGVSKAPICNGVGVKAALKIDERKSNQYSPSSNEDDAKLPRPGLEKREWPKFSVSLSKKEIEEDFIEMSKRRPPRRPQKRPRTVQKQLDMIFPGLWLSEITADSYKVHENKENVKR